MTIQDKDLLDFLGADTPDNQVMRFAPAEGSVKAYKAEDGTRHLEVLGIPYGGQDEGRDSHGEYFSANTEIFADVGDKRPLLYYHGLTPKGTRMLDPKPIGVAEITRRDNSGVWFDVTLDDSSLSNRVFKSAEAGEAKASSGAINYLVRVAEKTGEILSWALGELSLIDTGEGRQPANQLATVSLKTIYDTAKLDMPEAFTQTVQPVKVNVADSAADDVEFPRGGDLSKIKFTNEVIPMTDKEKEVAPVVVQPEVDETAIAEKVAAVMLAAQNAKDEAEKAAQAERKAIEETIRAEYKAKNEAWRATRGLPTYLETIAKNYPEHAEMDEFMHWIKTGDDGALKVLRQDESEDIYGEDAVKTINETTDADGAITVPTDFYGSIVSKLEQIAWTRNVGIDIMPVSGNVMTIPTEDSEYANYGVVAESGAATSDKPSFADATLNIYTFRKETRVTEEILEDNAVGIEAWLSRRMAEKWATTEGAFVSTGTGSSQPQGVFVGGTAGLTFDSSAQIFAAEIPELFYKLSAQYRMGASWLAADATEGLLRGIRDTSEWAFPQSNQTVPAGAKLDTFYGPRPIAVDAGVAALSTGNKALLIGNFQYYTLGVKSALSVARNPFVYQKNGEVAFYPRIRMGGVVTQAEAFQYGTLA